MSKLKKCPFCGNKARLVFKKFLDKFSEPIKNEDIKKNNGHGYFQIFCESASCCMTRYSTIAKISIDTWNRRVK